MTGSAVTMIRAVLVDDEKHALVALQDVLSQIDHIKVIGTFTNPLEAISYCEKHEVDVVFLDIEMPGIKGLDAADKIQEKCNIDIVFVTAYDHYGFSSIVQMFEKPLFSYSHTLAFSLVQYCNCFSFEHFLESWISVS